MNQIMRMFRSYSTEILALLYEINLFDVVHFTFRFLLYILRRYL